MHRWEVRPVQVGDEIVLRAGSVMHVDEPSESHTQKEWERIHKSKPPIKKPRKRRRPKVSAIGRLEFEVNEKPVASAKLTTENIVSVNFLWIDGKGGYSLVHLGFGEPAPRRRIPKIRFGDEIAIRTVAKQRKKQPECDNRRRETGE